MKITLIQCDENFQLILIPENHSERLELNKIPKKETHKFFVKMVDHLFVGYDQSDKNNLNKETIYKENAVHVNIIAKRKS